MSEIQVNTINEYTGASGVTIDGLLIKDGAIPSITGGKVLQVVEGSHTTEVANTTQTYADTGLTASITPSSSSNKILVIVNHTFSIYRGSTYAWGSIKTLRDSTEISNKRLYDFVNNAGTVQMVAQNFTLILDSPSSTSSLTYKTQLRVEGTTSNSHEVKTAISSEKDTIILMEIDA